MPFLVLVFGLTALASIWGPALVALIAGGAAAALSLMAPKTESAYPTSALSITGAFLFPVMAARWGESFSHLALSSVLLAAGAIFVFKGLKQRAMVSQSHVMFRVLTTGFLLSYLPLIRSMPEGMKLTWTLLLALTAMYVAYRSSSARFTTRSQRWIPLVAGLIASMVVGAASVFFLPDSFSFASMLILSMSVALAGLLGIAVEAMITGDSSDPRGWWRGLGPLLLAAPAFFYTFRLYLT